MAESSENSAGDGVDKKPESRSTESNLPVVWSPKLGAGTEDEAAGLGADEAASSDKAAHAETIEAEASEPAAATPPTRSWRFALLAAAIALTAATGSFVGTLTASGIIRSTPEIAPTASTADANASALLRALKSQVAELSAMKSSLDGAVRNSTTQFAAISDRLDRVERAASAPSAQLAHISDTVDRLNKVNSQPETTGSIAAPATPSEAKITDRIVQDWMVQAVRGDRALVESREGGLFEVGAGSVLPGLGKVESVKRQDGQWVVVTARGVITSGR